METVFSSETFVPEYQALWAVIDISSFTVV
jgi:hypothetical protein